MVWPLHAWTTTYSHRNASDRIPVFSVRLQAHSQVYMTDPRSVMVVSNCGNILSFIVRLFYQLSCPGADLVDRQYAGVSPRWNKATEYPLTFLEALCTWCRHDLYECASISACVSVSSALISFSSSISSVMISRLMLNLRDHKLMGPLRTADSTTLYDAPISTMVEPYYAPSTRNAASRADDLIIAQDEGLFFFLVWLWWANVLMDCVVVWSRYFSRGAA